MRKLLMPVVAILAISSLFLLQGCLKDSFTRTISYAYYKPVYKTTDEVRANIRSNAPETIEHAGKIVIKDQYIFLNETNKGIHIIDNSNPAEPKTIAFIDIPGNLDLAVKGNILYADLYTDLVAIDISDPKNAKLKKVVEGAFPERYYAYFRPDSTKVIASWEKRDTVVSEEFDLQSWAKSRNVFAYSAADALSNGSKSSSPIGVSGSMATFTIVNERLYAVNSYELKVFNISNIENPEYSTKKSLGGWNIETIYPFKNKLFIGSQNGMFIYGLSNPDDPTQEGQFSHVRSCDPVIADDNYAYVTLRSGTACEGFANQLDVLQLNNLLNPSLLKTYAMTNPHGLSKDDNLLFICDGAEGLKVYNAANVSSLQLLKKISGLETYDVIALGGVALVVAKDGLYQFDYTNVNNIHQLSKLTIAN